MGILDFILNRYSNNLIKKSQVVLDGEFSLDGLTSEVKIHRDSVGVPHIFAETIPDALFGQGFVHAQDRMWQMEFSRRLVAGRLSEFLGTSTLNIDGWMRTLSIRSAAESEIDQLSEEEREYLSAYCKGVNAAMKKLPAPLEFSVMNCKPEIWTITDSIMWQKMMAWNLSANWEAELVRAEVINRLGAERAAELDLAAIDAWPAILKDAPQTNAILERAEMIRKFTGGSPSEGVGSNNWAVSGQRSASGMPLFANDMHMALSQPAIWYENHLCAGSLNVTGISLPGTPFVFAGHNAHLVWGFTAAFADVQDLYQEHLRTNPDGQMEAEYQGEWEPAEIRKEKIGIKGGIASPYEIIVTRHGPVINGLVDNLPVDPALALRWTALEHPTSFMPLLKMNLAASCSEFHEALRGWTSPALNVISADNQGNLDYSLAGLVPVRARGDGSRPVPGNSGEYEWTGTIPFDELPHIVNPQDGYLATANNRVSGGDYPYPLGSDYCDSSRSSRIIELLESKSLQDVDTFKAIQADQVSPTARLVGTFLGQMSTDDPDLKPLLDSFKGWDGKLAVDSVPAAIFEVFMREFIKLVIEPVFEEFTPRIMGLGPNRMLEPTSLWGSPMWVFAQNLILAEQSPWLVEDKQATILSALCNSKTFLQHEISDDQKEWQWGKLHKFAFNHVLSMRDPLDKMISFGPFPVGGDATTIAATSTRLNDLSCDRVVSAPFRFIADLADLNHTLGVLAPGQSGRPGSPYFGDQVEDWRAGNYHVMLFDRAEIETDTQHILTLKP